MKVISLNIEGNKHFDRILPFLAELKPDVVCFQEIFECDIPLFEATLGYKLWFWPMVNITQPHKHQEPRGMWGVAWGARQVWRAPQATYYAGSANVPENYSYPNGVSRVLVAGKVALDENLPDTMENPSQSWLCLATTHFTWSPDGKIHQDQQHDWQALKPELENQEKFVLLGDLNSPRGGESWSNFKTLFVDHIPAQIVTTLDARYHHAGALELVVDACFSTPDVFVQNVNIHSGLSDHMAVSADVSLKSVVK